MHVTLMLTWRTTKKHMLLWLNLTQYRDGLLMHGQVGWMGLSTATWIDASVAMDYLLQHVCLYSTACLPVGVLLDECCMSWQLFDNKDCAAGAVLICSCCEGTRLDQWLLTLPLQCTVKIIWEPNFVELALSQCFPTRRDVWS